MTQPDNIFYLKWQKSKSVCLSFPLKVCQIRVRLCTHKLLKSCLKHVNHVLTTSDLVSLN